MDFKLLEFEINEVDKKGYIKFKIETQESVIKYDEVLRIDNKDDKALMESFETFINAKVVK